MQALTVVAFDTPREHVLIQMYIFHSVQRVHLIQRNGIQGVRFEQACVSSTSPAIEVSPFLAENNIFGTTGLLDPKNRRHFTQCIICNMFRVVNLL